MDNLKYHKKKLHKKMKILKSNITYNKNELLLTKYICEQRIKLYRQ